MRKCNLSIFLLVLKGVAALERIQYLSAFFSKLTQLASLHSNIDDGMSANISLHVLVKLMCAPIYTRNEFTTTYLQLLYFILAHVKIDRRRISDTRHKTLVY